MGQVARNGSAKKPRGISKLKIFIFALSYAYVAKTLAYAYSESIITQIERRFNIPSSTIGIINGSFTIGNVLVIAFVSYFGAKLHRPKVIGLGCLIMSLGSGLAALPHLLMPRYEYESTVSTTSNSTSRVPLCLANQSLSHNVELPGECLGGSMSLMWIFVLVGNLLKGIGETPVEPLGLSYVDEFSKKENSPFYIGIIQTISIVGPLLGYLLAALCAQLYVDIGSINLDDVTIAQTDIRWVGAWWIGFFASSGACFLATLLFWFLPKSLPREGGERDTEPSETLTLATEEQKGQNTSNEQAPGLSEFLRMIKSLFRNKIYMLFMIVTVLQFNAFSGYFSFLPKFVEQQYGKSPSEAIFLIGVYNLPIISLGYFLGGYYMKRFNVSTYRAAQIGFISEIMTFSINFSVFVMGCKNSPVMDLTVLYDGTDHISYLNNFTSSCNSPCDCPWDVWDPVCGDNGLVYISACHAGCTASVGEGQNTIFQNCSCVLASPFPSNGSATLGQCPREETCDSMLIYFMVMSFICCLIFSFGAMPAYMVLIRSLKPEEKSLGLGLHLLAARTVGGIPSLVSFGVLVDSTCLKWGVLECGEPGACRIYDTDLFRYLFNGIQCVIRMSSYVPCIFILLSLKREQAQRDSAPPPAGRAETQEK
ncbi:uncharacterized protein LOC398783 isoform X1 [Xenopus laevis]|uniref:Solute carrier organic anion transporter family member n=2 Tax=Xenopus laevis TaxID=8355 RepID=A0A8J1MGV1_XENLA|nr:uncharacterized protein LOC398783 isoform X1 [Xenopus laevis]